MTKRFVESRVLRLDCRCRVSAYIVIPHIKALGGILCTDADMYYVHGSQPALTLAWHVTARLRVRGSVPSRGNKAEAQNAKRQENIH